MHYEGHTIQLRVICLSFLLQHIYLEDGLTDVRWSGMFRPKPILMFIEVC